MLEQQIISPREAYARYILGKSMFVDVSETNEQAERPALNNLLHIPYSELDARYQELPQDRPVVFLSRIGTRCQKAVRFLTKKGYLEVSQIDGGIAAWKEEGLPLVH